MSKIVETPEGVFEYPDDWSDDRVIEHANANLSGGRIGSAFNEMRQSAVTGVGKTLEGLGRLAETIPASWLKGPIGVAEDEIRKRESQEQQARRIEENPLSSAGRAVTETAEEAFPTNPRYAGEFWSSTIPGGVGSVVSLAPSAIAGPLAPVVAGASYGMQGGERIAEEASAIIDARIAEAEDRGDTELAARLYAEKPAIVTKSFYTGAAISAGTEGVLGVAGRLLPMVRRGTAGGISEKLTSHFLPGPVRTAIEGAARESVQEGVEQVGANLAARALYDPERSPMEGVVEQMGAGGVVGGGVGLTLGGTGTLMRRSRAALEGKAAPVVPETPAQTASPPVKPPAPTGMPDWVRERMVAEGLDPNRTFNDVDLGNPSVREAIQLDPTLTEEQKALVLATGSLKAPPAEAVVTPPDTTTEAAPNPDTRFMPPVVGGTPPDTTGPQPPIQLRLPDKQSESNLGAYRYPPQTEKGREDYARGLVDQFAGKLTDAIRWIRDNIEDSAYLKVAAGEVALRASQRLTQQGKDADLEDANQALLTSVPLIETTNTDNAQALQASKQVNEKLAPYGGLLAYMRLIDRQQDRVVPKAATSPEAVASFKAGFKTAGDRAAAAIAKALGGGSKRSKSADWLANLDRLKLPDTGTLQAFGVVPLVWNAAIDGAKVLIKAGVKVAEVIERTIVYIKANQTEPFDEDGVRSALGGAMPEETATVPPKALRLLRKAGRTEGINWSDLFQSSHENQNDRKAELKGRVLAHPALQTLSGAERLELADALDAAWDKLRSDIFYKEFGKLVPLPKVSKAAKERVRSATPDLLKKLNLGLLDQPAFRDALAKKYGVGTVDDATVKRLTELGQRAQKAPAGQQRNKVYQEILRTLEDSTNLNPWDLLRDVWYGSVLMRAGTFINVLTGSFGTGAAFTLLASASTAVRGKPALAARMIQSFLAGTVESAQIAREIIQKGDYSAVPDFERRVVQLMNGKGRLDSLEKLWRRGNLYPGVLAYTRRFMTALDYVGAVGTRDMGVLFAAMSRGDSDSLQKALRRFDKAESTRASDTAKAELGADASAVELKRRTREILEEGINQDVIDGALELARRAAQNADPVGIPGVVYNMFSKIPFVLKAPLGLAFLRAALNMVSNSADWYPGVGAVTYARSAGPVKETAVGLDLPPEQRAITLAAQVASLGLTVALAAWLLDDDERPENFDVSGSWTNVTPQQSRQLKARGEQPNSIRIGDKWISYRQMPFAPILAIVGRARDNQRFDREKWDETKVIDKIANAWLGGVIYMKDISSLSGLAGMAGVGAGQQDLNIGGFNQAMARSVGRTVAGFEPSVLKEIDAFMDPSLYTPSKDEALGWWLRNFSYPLRQASGKKQFNMLGDPIELVRPPARGWVTWQKTEPVYELAGKWMGEGLFLPAAGRTALVVRNGARDQMNADEFSDYARFYGEAVKQRLTVALQNGASEWTIPQARQFLDNVRGPIQRQAQARVQATVRPVAP